MKSIYKFIFFFFLTFALTLSPSKQSLAHEWIFSVNILGIYEVPPNQSVGAGAFEAIYNDVTNTLEFEIPFIFLVGVTTTANFHGPAEQGFNAPVLINLAGFPIGVSSGLYSNTIVLTPEQEKMMLLDQQMYININTSIFPNGEIRGQLVPGGIIPPVLSINVSLSGTQVVPLNTSTATGSLIGTYTVVGNALDFTVSFLGITSLTTSASLHGPATSGVNAPVQIDLAGFPTGVTSGTYSNSYSLTSAQEVQLFEGLWYVNIRSNAFPGGEIRAQLDQGTLPVELSSFISNVFKNDVTLNWSTTNEINNAGFEVERKLSSSTEWTKVGDVAGNGNSNGLNNYTFSERINTGEYNYRLKQIDFNGNYEYFNLSNRVVIGLPTSLNLSQNYPNPFNPSTKIDYELPYDGNVKIVLFDISGKEIATLVNEIKRAGYNSVMFNASGLSSGIYIYRIESDGYNESKRMMLVK